ncbi:S-layer homology domain-containing protein [Paenibacillus sp. FSL R10-2736]|uniref:S-layer homology domain-containing protein n=1 Tax=Paenibacillus sp. FSL R10-2736 TaxID=2954692 RepID=UPI0030F5DA04
MVINRFLKNVCFIVLLFVLLPFSPNYASAEQMTDIKGHWAENDIQEWLDEGLITGYPDHTFQPGAEISRGEFVALVNRAFKYSDTNAIGFKDLKQTNWAYIEVQKAIAQGYIGGFSDNTFRAGKQITKQETAVIMSRILKLDSNGVSAAVSAKDSNLIPAWSKPAIGYLLEKGIMSNDSDGAFQPKRELTRAEAVVVIKKALSLSTVTYDQAGVFGGSEVIAVQGNVNILASNVTLKNMHILGDLVISKEIAEGDASLVQVQVDGVTRIEGGGSNSIHIKNSQLGMVSVNRLNAAVRVVAEGTTSIKDTQIYSSAVIEENGVSGDGFVNVTVLPETQTSSERTVSLAGDFKSVSVNTSLKEFKVRSGTVASLYVKENVVIPNMIFNKDVVIQNLESKSKLTVTGEGKVKAVTLSEGAKDSTSPKENTAAATPVPGGGTSGGGSSGGGGGGSSSPGTGGGSGTESPALAVTGITAANGNIDVLFNQALNTLPEAADFAVSGKINNEEFRSVAVSLVTLLDNKTTVRLTIPSISNGEEDQTAVYSLSYKGASSILSEVITVPKSNVSVTGRLLIQHYNHNQPLPMSDMFLYLTGVKDTQGTYTSSSSQNGTFGFDNVVPGTYIVNVYIYPYRYYTDEFTVEAGKDLVLPDIIIVEKVPEPKVEPIVYTDLSYLSGSVMYLRQPFKVKVELEDGTELNIPPFKFDTFFSLRLYDYNPDLHLKDKDKLFVTLYTDYGWSTERFEVNVVERPQTKVPVVTSVVYDDTRTIRGIVADYTNEITITRADGTIVGTSYNNSGSNFEIYMWSSSSFTVGEKLMVYAQASGKRKSDPAYITVVAPTAVTAHPVVTEIVYENDWHITGNAEGDAVIVVKRSDGTVIGQGKTGLLEYGGKFDVQLDLRPVAGETLYLTAESYEKLVSKPISVVVANRPVTPTPTIVGEVYSDYTYIEAFVQYPNSIWVTLKDKNGTDIDKQLTFNGKVRFWNVQLTPETQYQLTAEAPLLKESTPLFFTAVAPTAVTPAPTVTTSVYAEDGSTFYGIAEPFATVYVYYEDGSFMNGGEANEQGEFFVYMLSYPNRTVAPGDKLIIKADSRGKLISEAVVLTAILPGEKSSEPELNNSLVYGYTSEINGTAGKSALLHVYHEDGLQISTGSYSDMNTGKWSLGLWYGMLRGGDRIYIIADEVGKLPSDPLYITIQSAARADTPVVTGTISAGALKIQGMYSGAKVSNGITTTIFLVDENNLVFDAAYVLSDGSFSFDASLNPPVSGQSIRMFAKEGLKEASDLLTITVN